MAESRSKPRRTILHVVGLVLLGFALWRAATVFLVFFSGILLALFLRGLSDWIARKISISSKLSLAITVSLLCALCGAAAWLILPEINNQLAEFQIQFPRALETFQSHLRHYAWGPQAIGASNALMDFLSKPSTLFQGLGTLSSALGLLAIIFVILFTGLYFAASPDLYIKSFLDFVPSPHRKRIEDLLTSLSEMLQRWILGRLLLMGLNAIVTSIGLWLLGMPLALGLGILSGLLNFIPNLGPIVAAVPAVLLALLQSPMLSLEVFAFYVAYQMTDGYILTPLVQKRTVSLPPAFTLIFQLFFGVILGGFGVLLAVPMAASILKVSKKLLIKRENGRDGHDT